MKLGISQEELWFRSIVVLSKNEIFFAWNTFIARNTCLNLKWNDYNLDRTYISGLEGGLKNPSITAFVSLAAAMGISVFELLDNLEAEANNIEWTIVTNFVIKN